MAPPVVLVHGFGTSFELTWVHNGWVDLLGDSGRQVVGVDLLGHGSAPKPTDPAAYDDLGARVLDAIDDHFDREAVDVSSASEHGEGTRRVPVDAVGFSLGAKTLLGLAADHPGRFRSLIVSGVGANLFRRDDHTAVVDAIRSGDDRDNPALRYFAGLAELPGNDRAALAACMSNGGRPLSAEQVATITVPVLVVLGSDDFAGPADPLVEALPNARYVELPRTDHARTPKSFEFIDAALDFLSEQDAAA